MNAKEKSEAIHLTFQGGRVDDGTMGSELMGDSLAGAGLYLGSSPSMLG
jgi:hypothetical protein